MRMRHGVDLHSSRIAMPLSSGKQIVLAQPALMAKPRAPAAAASTAAASSANAAASAKSNERRTLLAAAIVALIAALAFSQSWLPSLTSLLLSSTHTSSSSSGPSVDLPRPPHWGTYRPGLYLGVRGLWPGSPLFGWAWGCVTANRENCAPQDQIAQVRHDAEERDGVTKYGWLQHNGEDFGIQGILDRKMGVNLTTSFVQPRSTGVTQKDRWVVRIEGSAVGKTESEDVAAAKAEGQTISLFFYTALADASHSVSLLTKHSSEGIKSSEKKVMQLVTTISEVGWLLVRSGLAPSSSSSSGLQAAAAAASIQTHYAALHIDESPPPHARQGQPPPPPQQYTWAAKDHIQRLLTERYRPLWNAHANKVRAAHARHREKYAGTEREAQFEQPKEPHVVLTLPNKIESNANFLVIQYVLPLPFALDFDLEPAIAEEESQAAAAAASSSSASSEVGDTGRWFAEELSQGSSASGGGGDATKTSLADVLRHRSAEFESRFQAAFPLAAPSVPSKSASGSSALASTSVDSSPPTLLAQREMAQALLSNLLGGLGYFHGTQLIELSPEVKNRAGQVVTPARIVETAPTSLFSAVPSRSFFPRGFLWDEGFHQLLVSTWSLSLSLRILDTWFAQIRLDSRPVEGWLPREQIPGSEARKRVPQEFQAQKPSVANPPTMILALERILLRLQAREKSQAGSSAENKEELALFTRFLVRWLPTLHKHVSWYFRTQASVSRGEPGDLGVISLDTGAMPGSAAASDAGAALPLAFRWAGRTKDHCLASGLDDYPRASWIPSLNKDKSSTSASAAQAARDEAAGVPLSLAQSIGAEGHVDLHAWMVLLARTMAGLMEYAAKHVHATESAPADAAAPAAAAPSAPQVNYAAVAASYRSYASSLSQSLVQLHWDPSARAFADWAYRNGTRRFAPHHGYVSLMPLFLGVLAPDAPQLRELLVSLREDRWALASPGGLRSLSKTDKHFGSGEDYWRGHVWLNMQFLAADALSRYAKDAAASDEVRSMASTLAGQLRATVTANVLQEYRRTGFAWEQYHALTGQGRKSHPFTGWTALTLLLMTEQ